MAVVVPSFPRPDRELRIDLSTASLVPHRKDQGEAFVYAAISQASSLIETGRASAAAAILDEVDDGSFERLDLVAPSVRGLRGGLRLSLGDHETSEQLLLEALAAARAGVDRDSRLEDGMINNLGVIAFRHYARPTAAEERFQMAIDLLTGDAPAEKTQRLIFRRNLGITRDLIGDFDGAAEAYRSALPETTGDPAAGLDIAAALAANREAVGRRDEGGDYLYSAFLISRQWSDEHPLLFARAADNLSLYLLKSQKFSELEQVAREHATVCQELLPPSEQWRAIQPLTLLAYAIWEQSRPSESGEHLRAVVSIQRCSKDRVPGATAVIDALRSLYCEHSIQSETLRLFERFAAKLSP